jgi:hypothetical protein
MTAILSFIIGSVQRGRDGPRELQCAFQMRRSAASERQGDITSVKSIYAEILQK